MQLVQRPKANNISFDERPVPGLPLRQAFFRDAQGLKIELTFDSPQSNR